MTTPTGGQTPEPDEPEGEAEQDQQPGTGKRAARLAAEAATARAVTAESLVAALQRREVVRLAAPVLAQPEDVLAADLGGVGLDALLDADGNVDADAVAEAAAAVVAARPGLAVPPRRTPSFDGGVRTPPRAPTTWSSVLRPRRQP